MSKVINLHPCKWSKHNVRFALWIVQLLADDLEKQGHSEAGEIVRGWVIPFTAKGMSPRKQTKIAASWKAGGSYEVRS